MPHEPPLLEAVNVRRNASGTEQCLLRDVSIAIGGGDRVAVCGPSGAGKSLLLRALALLDPLDEGEIRWRGRSVCGAMAPEYRGHVIYLHQRPPLLEGTVEENLRRPFQLKLHRDRRFDADRVNHWLEHLGRDAGFLGKRHINLSGGEGQILSLLRAMQLDPEVLLLDEPTAALDKLAAQSVEKLVQLWFNERPGQRATVWVSHDADQAARVSDVQWRIAAGRLTTNSQTAPASS